MQVHSRSSSPKYPQGHGLLAATSTKRAGKVTLPSARVSITDPLSMGWRIPCKTELLNSASSSKKSTPWWARDTSPGRRGLPPPTSPANVAL